MRFANRLNVGCERNSQVDISFCSKNWKDGVAIDRDEACRYNKLKRLGVGCSAQSRMCKIGNLSGIHMAMPSEHRAAGGWACWGKTGGHSV